MSYIDRKKLKNHLKINLKLELFIDEIENDASLFLLYSFR